MLERIKHMMIKEFLQTFRNPNMRGLLFMAPMLQILIFSYAMASDVNHIAMAIYDLDQSPNSRKIISEFISSGHFYTTDYLQDEKEVKETLDENKVQMVLQINHGFGATIDSGKTAPIQIILDGTDSNTSMIVMSYANRIVQTFGNTELLSQRHKRSGASEIKGSFTLETRARFNENLEKLFFYVPGIMGLLVTLVSLQLTAMAVVREKEIGTIEQIMVSPITPVEFILGKTVPFAILSLIQVMIVMIFGKFWFGIPFQGSVWTMLLGICMYLGTSLGVGLLISTVSQTQQQAIMTQFFYLQPVIMLSSFSFPVENMPEIIQWINCLNPMRYLLIIIRGVFLKGSGLDILWPQMGILGLMGIIIFWMASRRFKKHLS
ncbi:MAG: ABC transporter permease [Candidatus Riflebacteria bacterium]|nr:ABC transporter permease [Candidatus Riflebacteria bacterium]